MSDSRFDRRTCLSTLAAATLAAPLAAKADPVSRRTFVLIHGAWFGGWCWANVADRLRDKGHRVFTPSLTGLGDRAHLAAPNVTLSTHVADIMDVLDSEELSDIVLVAHSYSGVPCAMVAERASARIRRLIFLDAVLPEDGKPLSMLSSPKLWEERVAASKATPANGFPPPPVAAFGVADPDQAAWLERRLRPQPIGSYLEPPKLARPVGAGIDTVYVSCEAPAMAAIDTFRARARVRPDWHFQSVSASHACMISAPQRTADTLAGLVA